MFFCIILHIIIFTQSIQSFPCIKKSRLFITFAPEFDLYNNNVSRKKKELPLLENVTITDIAAEGKAIAKVNDLVIFVPYAPANQTQKASLCRSNSY